MTEPPTTATIMTPAVEASAPSESAPCIVVVRPDGAIDCVYADALGLGTLGTVTVERASTVEFDASGQEWVVRARPDGEPLFRHQDRSACLAWEVAHFNAALAAGLVPAFPDSA